MRDNKPAVLQYFEAFTTGDVSAILKIVSSDAKIQSGLQDWVGAPMVLPNILSVSNTFKFTMHEIFSNDDGTHFIIHYHAIDAEGRKAEHFKVVEFDLYGKISFIRLVTND